MTTASLRCLSVGLLLLAALFAAPAARAATTCTSTSSSLSFGTVSQTGNTDVTATFSVTCQTNAFAVLGNAKVRLCMNIGDGALGGGSVAPRRMLGAQGDALQFQLYTDAARTQVWGSRTLAGAPTPLVVDFDYAVAVLLGGSQTIPVTLYGRVPTQTLIAGDYANPFTGVQTSIDYQYGERALGAATQPASCIAGGPTGGATVSGAFPFTATATVPAACRALVTTDLDFGSASGVITSNIDQTSTIGMICTGRTAWSLGLGDGQNAVNGVRRMRAGLLGGTLDYALYRDPSRTLRWGTTANVDTEAGVGTGLAQSVTVYGRVPPQSAAAGSYADVVVVTITY